MELTFRLLSLLLKSTDFGLTLIKMRQLHPTLLGTDVPKSSTWKRAFFGSGQNGERPLDGHLLDGRGSPHTRTYAGIRGYYNDTCRYGYEVILLKGIRKFSFGKKGQIQISICILR